MNIEEKKKVFEITCTTERLTGVDTKIDKQYHLTMPNNGSRVLIAELCYYERGGTIVVVIDKSKSLLSNNPLTGIERMKYIMRVYQGIEAMSKDLMDIVNAYRVQEVKVY